MGILSKYYLLGGKIDDRQKTWRENENKKRR